MRPYFAGYISEIDLMLVQEHLLSQHYRQLE